MVVDLTGSRHFAQTLPLSLIWKIVCSLLKSSSWNLLFWFSGKIFAKFLNTFLITWGSLYETLCSFPAFELTLLLFSMSLKIKKRNKFIEELWKITDELNIDLNLFANILFVIRIKTLTFCLLFAHFWSILFFYPGKNSPELVNAQRKIAMIAEMIHSASLIHDDVIDQSFSRRGKPSVNVLWNHKKVSKPRVGNFYFYYYFFFCHIDSAV